MKRWILLGTAIAFELVGTMALRASQEHRGWLVLAVIGYVCAFLGLMLVLRTGLAIGVAYGIWGAVATAGTAALAAVVFDEPLTWPVVGGIALIIVGVVFVEMGSHSPEEQSI
ncbi:QacE family quaternary ammonium compound efflux SMR transporter [Mycolicibacterium fluoranthenivorans]|uniref:QacE family quaternary ammonium compound efflux SMR transporter n=1 Tax=Mycolicibacterium fluoranthenivorans TaxID=258505 RepID=A0A1G4WYL5_9MYCO|nr:SMR family transporter [Mycolicibacterium fluoranthenivorans]QNJ94807.1 QacE family quaternary ammonium compound efflux SMR transporter [Mycolicibacterium fluoranthenivorans]SCX31398.1 small multidrug resistance pump [Mycolicibacterium fluoranthenivorans]